MSIAYRQHCAVIDLMDNLDLPRQNHVDEAFPAQRCCRREADPLDIHAN